MSSKVKIVSGVRKVCAKAHGFHVRYRWVVVGGVVVVITIFYLGAPEIGHALYGIGFEQLAFRLFKLGKEAEDA